MDRKWLAALTLTNSWGFSARIGCLCLICSFLFSSAILATAQENANQATKPTQSQPEQPEGTPTQNPAQTPKTAPQVEQIFPSYEGQNVTSVELAGQPNLDPTNFLPLLKLKANEPFSQEKINESIAAIKQTGRFQDAQLEVRPETKGVRVLFVLQPATYYGIYVFPGAERFPYSRLLQVSNYPPKGAYTVVDVENARQGLERFFQRSGYFQAKVKSEVKTNPPWGLANVIFHIMLGQRAKFGQVVIEGTTNEQAAHLKSILRSTRARLRGAAVREGRTYKLKTLERATDYLSNDLAKQGYLDAKVHMEEADYSPKTNHADVRYVIEPGPVIRIKITGARVWSWNRRKLLPVYQRAGVDPELIQEGERNLTSYFQSKGYFEAKVNSRVDAEDSKKIVSYEIHKGPRHRVASVAIEGNKHYSDKELTEYLKVKRAHIFSHGSYSEQLVRTSVRNLENVYKADGFSEVKITPQVAARNGNLNVEFHIDEGAQDIVQALKIEGNKNLSEAVLAPNGLKLAAGHPYSQKNVRADRSQIMASYWIHGYLTASFRERVTQVPRQKHQLTVIYYINEGPQVRTATVVTLGRVRTKQGFINRQITALGAGEPLKADDMLTSETKLYNTGVFDWAEVDPRRAITTQQQEDILIKVHEGKPNTLTYGFGFDVIDRGGSVPSGTVVVPGIPPAALPANFKTSEKTFWGPRGTLEYTRNNLSGKGDSLGFSALAARLQQSASIIYTDPAFFWTNWTSNVSITAQHNSENPIFTFREAQFGYQLQRPLNSDKNQNLFLRYDFSETGLTNLLIPELVPPSNLHVRLSTLSASYIRDTRNNPTDASKGIYESLELDFNPRSLGSNFGFARLLAQTAYYKKIPAQIVWANSIRVGLEQPFTGSSVPLSETFFSGGGNTLRGFPLNGAGPQHVITACGDPTDPSTCAPITVPVGGPQLLILNSELRIPVPVSFPVIGKNLGVALFYDGGNVFPNVGFHDFSENYTNSVGGGLRYKTPVGPIRIDIGHNLNAPPGIKSTQFFITLGQAF
jgi:outer membrane protein insertion porin family